MFAFHFLESTSSWWTNQVFPRPPPNSILSAIPNRIQALQTVHSEILNVEHKLVPGCCLTLSLGKIVGSRVKSSENLKLAIFPSRRWTFQKIFLINNAKNGYQIKALFLHLMGWVRNIMNEFLIITWFVEIFNTIAKIGKITLVNI